MRYLFLLLFVTVSLLEAEESIETFRGAPADLLTFSPYIPIEMDAFNKQAVKEEQKRQEARNMQIEQQKSLPWEKLFLACIGSLSFLALIFWPRKKQEKVLENPKTVQEAMKEQLEELKNRNLPQDEYYRELSFILRTFIERRYGILALTKTTEEFLQEIDERKELKVIQDNSLKQFLTFADFVKFSGHDIASFDRKKAYDFTLSFIQNDTF